MTTCKTLLTQWVHKQPSHTGNMKNLRISMKWVRPLFWLFFCPKHLIHKIIKQVQKRSQHKTFFLELFQSDMIHNRFLLKPRKSSLAHKMFALTHFGRKTQKKKPMKNFIKETQHPLTQYCSLSGYSIKTPCSNLCHLKSFGLVPSSFQWYLKHYFGPKTQQTNLVPKPKNLTPRACAISLSVMPTGDVRLFHSGSTRMCKPFRSPEMRLTSATPENTLNAAACLVWCWNTHRCQFHSRVLFPCTCVGLNTSHWASGWSMAVAQVLQSLRIVLFDLEPQTGKDWNWSSTLSADSGVGHCHGSNLFVPACFATQTCLPWA